MERKERGHHHILMDALRRIGELERKQNNFMRMGKINDVKVDADQPWRVRVVWSENANKREVLSAWLPWNEVAGNIRSWKPPTVGEQVIMFSPSGELGFAGHTWVMRGGFTTEEGKLINTVPFEVSQDTRDEVRETIEVIETRNTTGQLGEGGAEANDDQSKPGPTGYIWSELETANSTDTALLKKKEGFQPTTAAPTTGMLIPGNLSLWDRPFVSNPDGTISTEQSFSVSGQGGEVLVPSVVNGQVLSQANAVAHYEATNEHLGVFDTPANATSYANWLHDQQEIRALTSGQQSSSEEQTQPHDACWPKREKGCNVYASYEQHKITNEDVPNKLLAIVDQSPDKRQTVVQNTGYSSNKTMTAQKVETKTMDGEQVSGKTGGKGILPVLGWLKELWDGASGTGAGTSWFRKTQTALLNEVEGILPNAQSLRTYLAGKYTRMTDKAGASKTTVTQEGGNHDITNDDDITRLTADYRNNALQRWVAHAGQMLRLNSGSAMGISSGAQLSIASGGVLHLAGNVVKIGGPVSIAPNFIGWGGSTPGGGGSGAVDSNGDPLVEESPEPDPGSEEGEYDLTSRFEAIEAALDTLSGFDVHVLFRDLVDQDITGGARVTVLDLGTKSSGTVTPDPGDRPMQKYVNAGGHELAPGSNYGNYILDVLNTTGAGTITVTGWTHVVGSFDTTITSKFRCYCSITADMSVLQIQKVV